jgi:mxaJ protein
MSSPSRSGALAFGALVIAAWAGAGRQPASRASAGPQPETPNAKVLRIAADPNNLPFSNEKREGFENKIADLVAKDLGCTVEYVWHAQRRGFFRRTMKEGTAQAVAGVTTGSERALTTRPYFRSTYVFVSRADRRLNMNSFDDPRLKGLKIGVQIIGDDGNNPPPVLALAHRGLIDNMVGFTVYGDYREESPPARIVDAVARGDVDVAVVWGPLAGYYAQKEPVTLDLSPVTPGLDTPELPLVFDISFGVRKGDTALRDRIQDALDRHKAEIDRILDDYRVPRGDPSVRLPVMGNDD